MKKLLAVLVVLSMLLCGNAMAEAPVAEEKAVCPIDATNLTVELPDGWNIRELMPTDEVNGVLLVAYNADMSVSLDVTKELCTSEEMQAKVEDGAQALEMNGIPYVMEEMQGGIWYYMTELTESSVLTFSVYADEEAYAANTEAVEQMLGSLTLSSNAEKSGGYTTGTVESFNKSKGYGYIISDNGTRIFVHYTGLNMDGFKSLEKGQRVSFDIINGIRGPQATNVTVE